EARALLRRRGAPRRGRDDAAGGGVPGVRRVRDGRGGCRQRLDRPRPRHPRDADQHPPRGRGHRPHVLGGRGRPRAAVTRPVTMPYDDDAPASQALFDRASKVTPGGVNSPVRAFRAVGGTPRFMVSGRGPYLTDADGKEYVDLVCSWGPMILGHAHPAIVAAIRDAAGRGTSFGRPSPGQV